MLDGGADRDNANWANFDLADRDRHGRQDRRAGRPAGQPTCAGQGPPTTLEAIEDIEGTNLADIMIGDAGPNQLLGRRGADSYYAAAGDDSILANSASPANPGDSDPVIDCGEGSDTALIDIPTPWTQMPLRSPARTSRSAPPNSFRPPDTPPDPTPPPPVPASASTAPKVKGPRPDLKAPQTRIVARPGALTWAPRRTRLVGFRFAANEARVRFRCRIDRGRFRPCRSPRRYRVRTGPHTFRVYAIDVAGNRDRSPAMFAFRVRRR